jgi:hypothetical protein
MGGVFNTVNLHLYHYAGNNPVKYTDPDGREDNDAQGDLKTIKLDDKFNIILPKDDRNFFNRLIDSDSDKHTPFIENKETGEKTRITIVKGTPPAVSLKGNGIIGIVKGLLGKGKNTLTVAKGVDLTLKSGEIGQVIIDKGKIIGFSKNAILHSDLAKSLGLNPKAVAGATVFKMGKILQVAPSSSVPGASKEVLGLVYNLIH